MNLKAIYLLTSFSLLLYNCKSSKNQSSIKKPSKQVLAEGYTLAQNNCFSCHNPFNSLENRLAPPMQAVKMHYIKENVSSQQFAKELIAYVTNPSVEKSKMPGAIKRFNLMPKVNLSEEELTKIANFIYYSKIEEPDWFKKHQKQERMKH